MVAFARAPRPFRSPRLSEDLSTLRSRLLSGTADGIERAALVDALPSGSDPAVVVGILSELLRKETEPRVQARALRRLGRLADAAVLDQVRPLLRSDHSEVVAAAAEAILRLDRHRGVESIASLLEDNDPSRRVIVVRALLDVGTLDSSGVIVRMSLSDSLDRRKLALELLSSIASEVAWPLAMRMFEQERDLDLMDEEARLLERTLPEIGIEKLYEMRLGLDLAREEQDASGSDSTFDRRLELIARTLASLFRTFRLTAGEIEALEQSFVRRARGVLRRVEGPSRSGDPRSESATSMARPRSLTVGTRPSVGPQTSAREATRPLDALDPETRQRAALLALAAVVALCLTTIWTMGRGRTRAAPGLPPPVPLTTTITALGKVGDDIEFEAEILQSDPARNSLVVLKDRAIAAWIFVRGPCPWALLTSGRPVRIEGRLIAAKDPRSVYVESDAVRPAALRP